jgi:hypothetical protein
MEFALVFHFLSCAQKSLKNLLIAPAQMASMTSATGSVGDHFLMAQFLNCGVGGGGED